MDAYDVKRLALVLALQSEIEGMKSFNKDRELMGHSLGYTESDFCYKASELREIANKPNEEL